MTSLRILSWNIRAGGGVRLTRIVAAIARHAPDVVVLSETRQSTESQLIDALGAIGLASVASSRPTGRKNGLLIAARHALRVEPPARPARLVRHGLLEAHMEAHGLTIGAVYGPLLTPAHHRYWAAMVRHARTRRDQPYILIGDFNSGESGVDTEGYRFSAGDRFLALRSLGWVDAWRTVHGDRREYTWYSIGRGNVRLNGFRLDHALVSPALAAHVSGCHYSHAEREERLSDHSLMLLEYEIAASWIPAVRAAGLDPGSVLQSD
ncbi:MAG TPA: endonuclease/exonuclease/phosphatase family protein [Gemmatimonadaceae bacterium]|nr:endonuclease/exonuclease/phosphatase family protein [Gemmatimonadaceae bacterium]